MDVCLLWVRVKAFGALLLLIVLTGLLSTDYCLWKTGNMLKSTNNLAALKMF